MKRHPQTGNPVVLALGVLPDTVDGAPRTSLLLFARNRPGNWVRSIVTVEHPIVDADFAIAPDGEPHIVASSAAGNLAQARLLEFRRAGR